MKKIVTIVAAIALAAALLAGCGAAATKPGGTEETVTQNPMAAPAVQNSAQVSQQTAPALITLEQAKKIALEDAGVLAADATFTKTRKERDDGMPEFEVDFTAGGWVYDYTIHAESGKILEREKELEGKRAQGTTSASSQNSTQATTMAVTDVSMEKAKSIALEHADVKAADATITKAQQKYDDGVLKYKIEFNAGGWEYEYTIHAGTGHILKHKKEQTEKHREHQTTNSPHSAASDISLEKAKEIALKHAGLTAAQVKFTKAKLDYDDGVAEYEIEFKCNGWEYEYTIHAGTGVVLEWEKDD